MLVGLISDYMVSKKRQRQKRRASFARKFRSPIGFSSSRARKLDLAKRAKNPRRPGVGKNQTGDFSASKRRKFIEEDEGFFTS